LIYQNKVIDTPVLRQLIRAGKAGTLVAKGVPGGFVLALREGLDEQLLEAQRGHARKFKRLEAVASYLKNLGAQEFAVELDQWSPKATLIKVHH
jgi:hypothetical protein